MKIKSVYIFIILVVLLFTSFYKGVPAEKGVTFFSGNEMTIDYRVIIGDELSLNQQQTVETILTDTFTHIDLIFNNWNLDSEISKFNALEENIVYTPSLELYAFLAQTAQIVQLTDGLFDPTIEPLRKLWRSHLEQGTLPSDGDIERLSKAVGWKHIHLLNGTVYKDHALTSIDLGGIVKGHCVDLLVERLNAKGFADIFVDWGGEIRTSGRHPAGRPWKIFISNLGSHDTHDAIAQIEMHDHAIATSGDYLQNWTVVENGQPVTYFHIINPKSNRPLIATKNSIASASVEAPTCAMADGIATALMLFPSKNEAQLWIEKIKSTNLPINCWLASREELNLQDSSTSH